MSKAVTDLPIDLNSVVWEDRSGPHGPYQRACNTSPAHTRLIQALKERGGSCILDGFRIWIFRERIYRRLQKGNLE